MIRALGAIKVSSRRPTSLTRLILLALLSALPLLLTACVSGRARQDVPTAEPTPTTVPTLPPHPSPTGTPLTAVQAQGAATVVVFLQAYNAGQRDTALALLTEDITANDCDYRTDGVTEANGNVAVGAWLQARIADHDRLVLADVTFGTPETQTGMFAVGVGYEARMSDTLRALGFPTGIKPQLGTKVIATKTGERIHAFINGAAGGFCRPIPP